EGAAQQGCQIDAQAGLIEACTLEGRFVISRQDPGLIRNAGRVRPQSQVISATLDYALGLALLLLNDVAEDAALLAGEILASGAQFIEHPARNEHGGSQLRSWMRELLPRILAEIFEQADVLKAGIALQIEDALGGEAEEMRDFFVGCIPKVTIMIRIFHQHFVRADGSHAIVDAVAAAPGLPLD